MSASSAGRSSRSTRTRSGASRSSASSRRWTRSRGVLRASPATSCSSVCSGSIALLGPRNGHTGLFPGDPSHTRELHLYPLRLYDFADGLYVVDAADASLVRSSPRRDRRNADREGPRSRRAARPARQRLEPPRNGAALRADRRGARRARDHRRRLGDLHASPARTGSSFDVPLTAVGASRVHRAVRRPALRPLPVDPPGARRSRCTWQAAPSRMWVRTLAGGKAVYMGYNSVQVAVAELSPDARAPRARAEHEARDRGRASQRRRRQHRPMDRSPRCSARRR